MYAGALILLFLCQWFFARSGPAQKLVTKMNKDDEGQINQVIKAREFLLASEDKRTKANHARLMCYGPNAK
jgi:hypothetical protein